MGSRIGRARATLPAVRVSLSILHELAADLVARGEDPRAADRFVAWARGLAGVSVERDGAELVIAWRAVGQWAGATGGRHQVRAATLAAAMDEIARG